MADLQISTKRMAIDKANAQVVIVVAVASFVAVFCLVASSTVFSQIRYQARVTSVKNKANAQLKDNIKAYNALNKQYQSFNDNPTNIIGGTRDGSGANDGRNSTIVLDALPPVYDFPGVTSSIEKILGAQSLKVSSITGTDDQLNQQTNLSSPTPQPVSMPFTFTVGNASYVSIQQLMDSLQKSIRPIQIDSLTISGGASNMTATVNAHTYYQPAKNLTITKKVVK